MDTGKVVRILRRDLYIIDKISEVNQMIVNKLYEIEDLRALVAEKEGEKKCDVHQEINDDGVFLGLQVEKYNPEESD